VIEISSLSRILTYLALIAAFAFAPAALADKGGTKKADPSGSLSLVLLDSTDGLPHWGQQITFTATSTAKYDFVTVMCYQSGTWVYGSSKSFGFGSVSPQVFYLQSAAWTGGAADCNANLWASTSSGTYLETLATRSFHVEA
jgi:hypothetical protein